jgi:transcriptional regulator GlxA family with amidase domain
MSSGIVETWPDWGGDRVDRTRTVVIVLFDGVKMLDVSGPAEVFAEANRFGARYALTYASSSESTVVTSAGTRLAVDALLDDIPAADTVIVTGGDNLVEAPIPEELIAAVGRMQARTERIVSICTGSFILAAAGILSGRRATTHWRHTRLLSRAYPDVEVLPDALFVEDGQVFTSAGVTAGIDLALALIERDHGASLAREVARSLVMFMQRPAGQSQFSAPLTIPPPQTSVVRRAVDIVSAQPSSDHSSTSLAAAVGVSPRHLTRLFGAELGVSPAQFVLKVRLDHARSLLDAGHDVARAARESGFGSTESMRRVFLSHLGVSPSAYRSRFRTTVRPDPAPAAPLSAGA